MNQTLSTNVRVAIPFFVVVHIEWLDLCLGEGDAGLRADYLWGSLFRLFYELSFK